MTPFRSSSSIATAIGLCVQLALISACSAPETGPETGPETTSETVADQPMVGEINPLRNAYFGDLHVHTSYSFDAYVVGTRAGPDEAYRYARGGSIDHPSGYSFKLAGGPLDFLAVTDHARLMGLLPEFKASPPDGSRHPFADLVAGVAPKIDPDTAFGKMLGLFRAAKHSEMVDLNVAATVWEDTVAAANRHYEPGVFTTFIGYEFTSAPKGQNLHRNVIFRGDEGPALPFSAFDSENPEDLWKWMDSSRTRGMEVLAIPHNSNASNGQMFRLETFDGEPLDGGYAETRMRNEPIVEVTQVKGTSEVHPVLFPNDEWAEFEIFPYIIASQRKSEPGGGYVREAYLNGLEFEEQGSFNPFRFGLIGSTDTHNSGSTVVETNFRGKLGVADGTPLDRGSVPLAQPGADGGAYGGGVLGLWSASGLAGIWAEENTREALFDALRRKETFATSGPRIRVRFFGGFDFDDGLASDPEMIAMAYSDGVPMGGDLDAGEGPPRFLIRAIRDPNSAPLQRLQIVKGWIEDGEAVEKVIDVACSDGLVPDPDTLRCPDNGAAVNPSDCSISQDNGAAELSALWTDPEFEGDQRAFYYVRVLENPKCRWSTWDALRAGVAPREDLPATIQDRAWSSPIWYVP